MSKVAELFGYSTQNYRDDWGRIIDDQHCPFIDKKCYKVRKSDPNTSIGTCTVLYGEPVEPIIICPSRLIEHRQIFTDCLHLLTNHEPGNELHIIPEVSIPGGNVDYFLVSAKEGKVKDFVGIELQTLDTTGTVWPERQRLIREIGIIEDKNESDMRKFGMNWKMTAKTILVQMHHKIDTFENVNRKLVLVVQNELLEYMKKEFNFSHLKNPATIGDSMHFHVYSLNKQSDSSYHLIMQSRLSTDAEGIEQCLGLHAETKLELERIFLILQTRLSQSTLFTPV